MFEILENRPELLGTGLDEDTGIMAKSGTTEWSDKVGAWICWCIHPASVLHHRENEELFQAGIENFARKVEILGGIGR